MLPGALSELDRQENLLAWVGDRVVMLGGYADEMTEDCVEVGDEGVWLECRHMVRAFDDGAVLVP